MAPDPFVRPVQPAELDSYLPAAIAMFTEEVGVDPRLGDGGAGYRARVSELISAGRAFARFENGEVVFKAEIGAMSSQVGQIQGVWVHPARRGRGLGTAGTAAVADRLAGMGRLASLYVNGFNQVARAALRPGRVPAGRQLRDRPVLRHARPSLPCDRPADGHSARFRALRAWPDRSGRT